MISKMWDYKIKKKEDTSANGVTYFFKINDHQCLPRTTSEGQGFNPQWCDSALPASFSCTATHCQHMQVPQLKAQEVSDK